MRIAISGSHRVGKTSLAEALASELPGYELMPEPYHALDDEGHEFGEMPSLDDFVAYLQTHVERGAFDLSEWADRIRDAMAKLSLLVFVPIERPDRIAVPAEERRLRAEVDETLEDLVMDGRCAGAVEVLHVGGTLENRVAAVQSSLRSLGVG